MCDARTAEQEENWALAAKLWQQCIRQFGTGEQPWWHSNYARAMLELHQEEEAESVLRQLVQDHPDYPPGWASWAALAHRQGRWAQSAELWGACFERFPTQAQPGWYTNYARALVELGRYQEAEPLLEKVIEAHPDFSSAYSCFADLAQRQQTWQAAAERWETCIRLFDQGGQQGWHTNYAWALIGLGKYEQAQSILQEVIAKNPSFPHAHSCFAELAYRQRAWEEAAERWLRCIRLFDNGSHPGWRTSYARALIELEQYDQAQSVLLEVIDTNPNYTNALSCLADLATRQTSPQEAARRWALVIPLLKDGEHPEWCANYARALMELGDDAGAQAVLLKVVADSQPNSSFAYANLASIAYRQGKWEESAKRWETCIRLFDDGARPGWHANYARSLTQLKRYRKAKSILLKVIETHPDHSYAHWCLADLAYCQKAWTESVEGWESLIQNFDDGEQPDWHLRYARTLIELERYQEAEAVLSTLKGQHPSYSLAWSTQANLASRLQQWERAEELWRECIERFPDGEIQWWSKSLAHALMKQEKYAEAGPIYLDLRNSAGDDDNILENLAKISFIGNDFNGCRTYAAALREKYPDKRSGYRWGEESLIKLGRFREAADVHLAWPGTQNKSDRTASLPENYPKELVLPAILGNGNDYGFIDERVALFDEAEGEYSLPVSIIIPVYNRAAMLSRTLAALTHQTYPGKLMEIIIADDGSSDHPERVVDKYRKHLNIRYVRQEDQGYRLAAVRNLGIRQAQFDHIILLDCDVIPMPDLVEEYMRYFHVTDRAALFGLRRYVCADEVSDDDLLADPNIVGQLPSIQAPYAESALQTFDGDLFDWREALLVKTDNLKEEVFPFRAFVGCNAAFPKSVINDIGYFDEEFTSWGGEDIEFGYRIYNLGFYFIPVRGALGLHQEASSEGEGYQVDRETGKRESQPIFECKCPLPTIRGYEPGRVYQVPKVSIYIPAYNVAKYIRRAVDSVLAQSYTDLEVVICNDGSTDGTLEILERVYHDQPHVRWISQPNQGIAATTNAAVNACRGMYVGQLDADDELHPTAVATMVGYLDRENVGLVYGCDVRVDRDGHIMRFNECVPFSREHLLVSNICTPFRMFRKRDWMRTTGCDTALENAVDYDLMQKLSEVCSVGHIPEVMYSYRIHGENTSLSRRKQQEENHLIVVNNALNRMGLSDTWLAVAGSEENRRKLRFMKLN